MTDIKMGQKAKIAGDVFISTDETNGKQYAIAPISNLIGRATPRHGSVFMPQITSRKILGYVYIGYIDNNTNQYKDHTHKNETRPFAIYPAPNDTLVATKDVSLRAGPRRWDAAKRDYVNAKIVQTIKQGQHVKVGGDTILAKGGLSIWTPISATDPPSR